MDDSDIKRAACLDSGMIASSGSLYSCMACGSSESPGILSIDHKDGCPLKAAIDQAFDSIPDGAALGATSISEATRLDILSKVTVEEIARIDSLVEAIGAAPPEDVLRARLADSIYELLPAVDRQLVASVATSARLTRQALENFRLYLLFELGVSRDLPRLQTALQSISKSGNAFDSPLSASKSALH